MSDKFTITPLEQLLQIILNQLDKGKIFGIPEELFFVPKSSDPFRSYRFGRLLETPIGVAAGPHTQLSQNIVAAWLTGARYIELKTIQTLDELNVSKPCIDMQDEGYNCEWSQELKIRQSFEQYLDAWIIIHVLKHKFNRDKQNEAGVIFNMSVGYDYEGILNENVQWFFRKMSDASLELNNKIDSINPIYPDASQLDINPCISNNITLSTMHGCPVDEIEKIGLYLLEKRKLHTSIKMNPTLLGKEELHSILKNSGFETKVPDTAFEHDPTFEDAVRIIRNLEKAAKKNKVRFGLKLTNTLESLNHKHVFPPDEKTMYMSGRVLHPISVNLAYKLQNRFHGELDISFSAGVDAFNLVDVVSCGLYPATVCSDILKPGGYGRLHQYPDELGLAFKKQNASSVHEFIAGGKPGKSAGENALDNLKQYAKTVLENTRYKKTAIHAPDIKTGRALGFFDCIHAPCVDTCPTNQDIPGYLYYTAHNQFDKALDVVLKTNPFPRTTGMVCDHLCQTKCTRINYDSPVLIREIKRFLAEKGRVGQQSSPVKNHKKIAIIGAGPSGLSCAYFLVKTGFEVNLFEAKPKPGGMVSGAIPAFRLTDQAIENDIEKIKSLGVKVHYNHKIDKPFFKKLRTENDFIYIATGAQSSIKLNIENIGANGVLDPLQFLFNVKRNKPTGIGSRVVIIGGGNTAMDAARTAYRLVGKNGTVTIIYRRTIKQMPADAGEIKAVLEEGINIMELTSPVKLNVSATSVADKTTVPVTTTPATSVAATPETDNKQNQFYEVKPATEVAGTVQSLACVKMKLSGIDSSGRPKPVPVPGSEFTFPCDTVIPAIGQELNIDFTDVKLLKTKPGQYETQLENVFIGGDAMRGASTAINAIGDGRKAAGEIIRKAGLEHLSHEINREPTGLKRHIINRAKKIQPVKTVELPLSDRKNFKLISQTLTADEAVKEASRCLLCDEVCNTCVTVCPNLAFHSYQINPVRYNLQKMTATKEGVSVDKGGHFKIEQKYQILHIADWCNECGNCTTFCPTADSPYQNKPHLYLNKNTFDEEQDGYFLDLTNGTKTLYCKKGGQLSSIGWETNCFVYETAEIKVILSIETFEIMEITSIKKDNFEIDLKDAAEMSIIMQGAVSFYGL